MFLATGVLATAIGAGGGAGPRGSVPACTAAAVQVIERHAALATVSTACRGLSRSEVNLALGRAIFTVAGAHQHKTDWRRRAAVDGARLSRLIESQRRSAAPPAAARPGPGRAAPASRWGLGLGALAAWLLTMGIGAIMLAGWIRRGGLRRPGGRSRLSPVVTLGHAGLAGAGLLVWIAYLASGWTVLAWLAVGVLVTVVGLGMATLTVWTSRARPAPAGQAAGPPRAAQDRLRVVLPIVHGLAASATILLALLTALTVR